MTRLVRLCLQLAVLAAVLPALALAQSRDSTSTSPAPPRLDDGWTTVSPAEVGLDPGRLAAMTAAIRRGEHGNVHAFLIEKDGRLVYEEYFTGADESLGEDLGQVTFGRTSLHDVRSVSKSIISTLVGIAPERLAGLVYLENPLVAPDYRDPLVRTYAEMYWRGTCDLGAGDDAIARTGPRAPWRPHFLYDDAARIDVPALRFFAPQIESRSVDLRRLDRLARIAASDHCGDQVARDFFTALAADEERVAAIRQALTEGDLSLAVHHAMGRAFGTNLRTVTMERDFAGQAAIRDFRDPHVRSFLEDVALREAARQPAPALDLQPREWP